MSLVYVFAASPMEEKPVQKLAVPSGPKLPGRCGPNQVVLVLSGMGPKSSECEAEKALGLSSAAGDSPASISAVDGRADAVLVSGLCGGLSEKLSEGQIVLYSECRSTERFRVNPSLLSNDLGGYRGAAPGSLHRL